MKTIRTLLLTSLASLIGLSLAQAANVPMTVTVNTSSSNASSVYGTSMTVRLYNGNVIAVTPVANSSPSSSGSYYAFTYSFSIPDTNMGLAVSVGNATTTGSNNKYFTALFNAAASVTIPGEGFPYSGPNATWPTSTSPTVPPPQTGDLTIRNFSTNPDGDLDFTMRLDIGTGTAARTYNHVSILSETAPGAAPVPTLSQRFLTPRGEWRWSLQTATTLPQEVKVMTLGATLSAPLSNVLSLYHPANSTVPAIKLDTGTGGADTAKITIGTHTVLTDDVALGLYLTQTAATGLYLTQTAASTLYPRNINGNFSEGYLAIANGGTGGSSVAMGNWSRATGNGSTAIGINSVAEGERATALGGAYATNAYATAFGLSAASGIAATALGASTAIGQASTSMGDSATALGDNSAAIGLSTTAQGLSQFVVGQYNLPQYNAPNVGNPTDWILTDELFTIGNGIDDIHQSNAFVVLKNGDTAVSGKLTVVKDAAVTGKLTVVKDAAVTGNLTAQGSAHVVGAAQFDGPVRIAKQGDIDMGVFVSIAPVAP